MRAIATMLAIVVLSACVPGGAPRPTPSALPTSRPTQPTVASDLPAVDPVVPSAAAFARQARRACAIAVDSIAAVPISRDPFLEAASADDVTMAEAHYRAVADAWTAMAGTLWEFGVPHKPAARRLITQLDTVAQYADQAADLLAERDLETAQVSIGWTAQEMRQANRLAAQLGLGPLDDCGASRTRLAGATTVTVVATDFAFAVAPLRHGPTHFVVRNRGQQPHQLFVVGLRAAGTLDEALAADRENGDPGPFLADAGAVSHVVPPGGRTWLDVDLGRGPTALLCFLPLPDATPHAYKGMAVEIDVR